MIKRFVSAHTDTDRVRPRGTSVVSARTDNTVSAYADISTLSVSAYADISLVRLRGHSIDIYLPRGRLSGRKGKRVMTL